MFNAKRFLAFLMAFLFTLSIGFTFAPVTAEAKTNNSIGHRMKRTAENNIVRFFDRAMKEYSDQVIRQIRDAERARRAYRNNYRAGRYSHSSSSIHFDRPHYDFVSYDRYGRPYIVGSINRHLDSREITAAKMIQKSLETGNPITTKNKQLVAAIVRLCQEAGIAIN